MAELAAQATGAAHQAPVDDQPAADAGALPVGVGAAGVVDLDGTVRYAPNIDWADYPLRAELEALLDVAVTVDNDANAAAWGEYAAGAA
ncbi:MAG TPA: ROK family protein, partial [Egibacteraceae bacterium]|nr:ROK family protein [Egibacteraceae bacterium]